MDFQPMIDFMRSVTDWIVPGAVCAVYRNGERVFFHAEGFSDLENRVPMRGDELFNFYSCSKVTTAVAALQCPDASVYSRTLLTVSCIRAIETIPSPKMPRTR